MIRAARLEDALDRALWEWELTTNLLAKTGRGGCVARADAEMITELRTILNEAS